MKKLLIATTLITAATLSTSIQAKSLEQYSFQNSDNITISFEENKATLSTQCYDAVGFYNSEKNKNIVKVDFALQEYINVKDCSKYEAEQSKIALHTLIYNNEINFKLSEDFKVTADFYSDMGSIMSFNVSHI